MTGKWHNGQTSAARVFPQARDVFFGGMTSDVSRFPVHDIADGTVGPERTTSKHQTELFVDNAIEFIRHQTNGQPFFCYVAFKSPHDPRIATPAWHAFYNTNLPPVPVSFLPQHPFNNGDMEVRDEQLLPWPRTPEAVRQELADHYACVSHVDEQIGRLLKQLESAGLLQTTLIAFASDNGLSLGDHGLIGKQNLYEFGGMNVPLILSGPGVPKNRRTDAFCYLMDVMPTVAGLAKVPALEGIDGRSLVPVLEGKEKSVWPVIFTSYRDCQRAIRDERWKLIRYPLVDRTQLYDLAADPHELKDLSGQPDEAERITRMLSLMAQYQREFGDTAPLKVANPKPAAWTSPEVRGSSGSPKKGTGKQKAKKETSIP
jgi:arylsulfatase A-like enzyme